MRYKCKKSILVLCISSHMRGSFDCFHNIPHMTGDVTYMHTNLTSYSLTSKCSVISVSIYGYICTHTTLLALVRLYLTD